MLSCGKAKRQNGCGFIVLYYTNVLTFVSKKHFWVNKIYEKRKIWKISFSVLQIFDYPQHFMST